MSAPRIGEKVPDALKQCMAHDSSGTPYPFESLWEKRPVLFVFIRHFGCIGCSENVSLLRPRFRELAQRGVRIILLGCGGPRYIEAFRARQLLISMPVEILCDESLSAHRAIGLAYGQWGNLSPRALFEAVSAFFRGHVQMGEEGDGKQQAGVLLVDTSAQVHFYHRSRTLGDHASPHAIVNAAMKLWLGDHPTHP